MIITPTLVLTFLGVFILAAWVVIADIKSKREDKKNSPEGISKRIGVPLDLYLEHERDSSFAISELIRILSTSNKDPQKIEYLKLLKEEKVKQEQEEERKRIGDQKATPIEEEVATPEQIERYERFMQKVHAVLRLIWGFILCSSIVSVILYACTLVLPILQFSWFFVFVVTAIIMFSVFLWHYENR